jgi:F-type H+-transporting ATPase subunit gamma
MPSLRDIRRRIRSIRNTAKITKAMQLVAASKLRRAQQRVLAARPYAEAMRELISELAGEGAGGGGALHPLLAQRPVHNVGVVLVTPDRGLAGSLNTNIIRRGTELVLEQDRAGHEVQLITVGRRGQDFMARRGYRMEGTFSGLVDRPNYDDVIGIARLLIDAYVNGQIDRAYLVYPRFVSTLQQRPEVVQILPVTPATSGEPATAGADQAARSEHLEYIFEPDPATILDAVLPRYVEVLIYQAILETGASFYSAQMVAMRNATDNANDLVDSYTLTYNKVRQTGITREVTEIASAAEAMAAAHR